MKLFVVVVVVVVVVEWGWCKKNAKVTQ